MGTSQTSKGPSTKSPLEPEWLTKDIIDAPNSGSEPLTPLVNPDDVSLTAPTNQQYSPNRFKTSRSELSKFLSTGDNIHLRKSLSSYIQKSGGPSVVARHHAAAIYAGVGVLSKFAKSAKEIREALGHGKSAKTVLHEIVNDLGISRGLLESENLIEILDGIIDKYEFMFDGINADGKNVPWRDILVDFVTEWIFRDYVQNVNFFERGSLEERIGLEKEIKAFVNVYARYALDKVDVINMQQSHLLYVLHQCFQETYNMLKDEVMLDE